MPVDPTPHLIVPFAQCSADGWQDAISKLELKNLTLLLKGMKLASTDPGSASSLSMPHERVLARVRGYASLTDGLIPLAAHEASDEPGAPWAWVTPCHWAMGRTHATFTDPAALELDPATSSALLATMQPYFATEGITLHYAAPDRWLAQGEVFRNLPTASIDRVLGRDVDKWLPASKPVKLLQNEMQMLLYTHPINDQRAASGLRSINSFWVSGSGVRGQAATADAQARVVRTLAPAVFAEDWAAYAAAWTQLDATEFGQFLALQKSSQALRLSLCGESSAMTFETAPQTLASRLRNVISPQRPINLLQQL